MTVSNDAPTAAERPLGPGLFLGTLLVAGATGFGAYSLARLTRTEFAPAGGSERDGAVAAAVPPPAPASAVALALRAGDDCFAPTLMRPRPEQVQARLVEWWAALPAEVAVDPALAPLLDEWAAFARGRGDAATAAELVRRADGLDGDGVRQQIRAAAARGDGPALRALAFASFEAGWPATSERLLARALSGVGLGDVARRLIERRLAAAPDDLAARLFAAELLARDFPFELLTARDHAAAAQALAPGSRRALLLLAELQLRLPDAAASAVASLQAATRARTDDALLECALGVALLNARFFDEARGRFERALALDPALARAAAGIGEAWRALEEPYRAIGACQRSLEIADNPEARDLLATIYFDTRNRERAWRALDEAIVAWPDDAMILDHHSASLGVRGRHAEAIAGLRRAVQLEPWNVEFLNDLAWELVNSGDPTLRRPGQGLELAQRACALEPGNAWYVNTLGVAWYRNDEYARAVEVLQTACALPRGGGPIDHYFLAMACHQLGQPAAARDHYDEAELLHERDDPEMERIQAEAKALLQITAEDHDG